MIIIFLLIPLSIVIALFFLGAFIWAVRSGQYEDTCTPAMRLLLEETKTGSIAESVGEKDASQQQAGESVTRSDRRRRELEARSSSPPLARLLLGSLAASGGTGDHTLAVANRLESPDITGSLCGLCKKSTHRLC